MKKQKQKVITFVDLAESTPKPKSNQNEVKTKLIKTKSNELRGLCHRCCSSNVPLLIKDGIAICKSCNKKENKK